MLNLYLGLFEMCKNVFGLHIMLKRVAAVCPNILNIDYLLESINFVASMIPNKHKLKSKDFFTTWPNLFLSTFMTVREVYHFFIKFFLKSLFAT